MNNFLRILFPESCPVCTNPSTDHRTAPICTECWQAIAPYEGPACQKCGKPLASDVSITCGDCLEDEPAFEWVRGFGIYDGALKKAITIFKYHGIRRLSKPLSDMMLDIKIPQAEAIVPVPLYKKRFRGREFNQSALLAVHLSRQTGIPVVLNSLVRIKDTVPQVGLSAKERRENIKNAFAVIGRELIQGKDVVLIDDVFTTGATVRECSRVLKKSGAGNIYAVTLAHSRGD